MILIIDNYDSFTYNLVQRIGSINPDIKVVLNNQFKIDDIWDWSPSHIIISPGPGRPEHAGLSMAVIQQFREDIPILGVCLGHQCIGTVYGAEVQQAKRILHGKTSLIHHSRTHLFQNIPSPFQGARYHSLSINTVPDSFDKSAWTNDGEIMAITHKEKRVFGVQFHPESFLTPLGSKILENFLNV
ncbi:MAG: aminodeoxychorismate/anthranilate synthase component II [Candidatus Marinimicrobia bacterium]|nr:aminodeoxychorismate/anthranilate synthase component II [Candidatus Neomarinimicrobiota bacterium]